MNVLASFRQTRNNNKSTKLIILQLPRQISEKFRNNYVNAFAGKKIRVIASAICLLKNPDASIWQEAGAKKLDRVILALDFLDPMSCKYSNGVHR